MHRAGYLLIAALLLAACAGAGGPGTPDDLGGTWELVDGLPAAAAIPPPGATATLVFDGNQLDGRSFCNDYSGPYRIDAGVLVVEGLGGTEMGCEPAVMAAESAYLAALGAGGELAVADDELVLTGDDATLRFRRVPPVPTSELVGTDWVLDTLVEGEVVSSVPSASTLRLDADGSFHATTACHELVGSWTTSGAQLRLPDLVTEDRACADELRTQDEHELAVLGGGPTVEITADRLTLTGPFGVGLSYRDDAG